MTFVPVVPANGLAGWQFLQRTYDKQYEAHSKSPTLERDTDYFLANIGSVSSAKDLVSDRRLLSVALGAFGLQDDLGNRYFIRRILEDGTTDKDALANKLADQRYKRLSQAFGFGPGETITTNRSEEMATLAEQNRVQQFEIAVGDQDDSMRIALFAQRELDRLAREPENEKTIWFSIMGVPPLRRLFETALGLPSAIANIDIDKQLEIFRDKTLSVTGSNSVTQFADSENRDRMINLFLARSQIKEIDVANMAGLAALQLLRSSA